MAPGDYPTLSRPPLREALIDIRLSESLSPAFIEKLKIRDLAGFSRVGDINVGGVKLEVAQDKPAQATITSDEMMGARFDNADKSQVVQFRRNGMTFSVLRNYKNWQVVREAAREFWQRFLDLSGPLQVGRLAVRYVNVIDVPLGADFDDYLTAAPRVPKGLPQLMSSFLERIVVPFTADDINAIITQTLENVTATSVSAILDIDVISQGLLDGTASNVWETFERLRVIKNLIFFKSLTEKALELYR